MESVRCPCLTLMAKQGSTQWSKFSNRQAANHFMRHVILSVLLVTGASFARAEDITTTEGKVFKNAEVIRFEADGLVVKHEDGTNWIAWRELSVAVRQRYQAEARNQKDKEIQKLKQDLARAEAEAARLASEQGQPESKNPPPPKQSVNSTVTRGAAEAPAKPVAELPPLRPDEMVDAADLVQQFKNDPPGADRRYHNKTFRV